MHNVAVLAVQMGKYYGLDSGSLINLKKAGEFHDIGKCLIKNKMLLWKKGLTPEEFEVIKEHSILGAEYLEKAGFDHEVILAVRHHHERWDGTGYPDRLEKEKIPLLSRIMALADTYDAMVSGRPYRKSVRPSLVIREIRQCAGTQFDPELVEIFIKKQKRSGLVCLR